MQNKIMKSGISAALLLTALYLAVRDIDVVQLKQGFSNLSLAYMVTPTVAILISSLFASLRVRSIARALGYTLSLRDSIAVLSLGQLGGALFFRFSGSSWPAVRI